MPREKTGPDGLTEKQRLFALEYLVSFNAKEAATKAGYSAKTAHQIGHALLSHEGVQAFLRAEASKRAQKLKLSADRVLEELMCVAFADIGEAFDENGALKQLKDMPEGVRRSISSIDVDELWEGFGEERKVIGVTKKVKFWSKTEGNSLLGKHLKLFTDKIEVKDAGLTDEERTRRIAALLGKARERKRAAEDSR